MSRWTRLPTSPSRTTNERRTRLTGKGPSGPFFIALQRLAGRIRHCLHMRDFSACAPLRLPLYDPPRGRQMLQPETSGGAIAQLVERLNGIQEVRGSTPLGSTSIAACFRLQTAAWPAPSGSRPTVCPRRIVALPTVLDGTLRGFRLSGSAAGTTAFAAQVFSQSFCEPSFRVRVCRTVRKLEERGNLGVQSSVGRKRIGKEQSQSR